MLEIITVPNPILRQKAKKIGSITPEIKILAQDMLDFLSHGPEDKKAGVGLAAPQIGQSIRIIAVYSRPSRRFLVMVNPEIVWQSLRTGLNVSRSKYPQEGCLSVPGIWGLVRRHNIVKLRYQTLNGQRMVRRFRGLTSVIVQHEVDHLNGILFTDRIAQQKGKIITQND